MNAIILDDEFGSIQTLEALLDAHFPEVNLLQTFQRAPDALAALPTLLPDLIFLDIEMPDMNGFAFLEALEKIGLHPEIIFTTAYNQHKSRSRQFAALDFLVKPIDVEPLKEALDRARAFVQRHERETRAAVFLQNQRQSAVLEKRIVLPGKDRSLIVRLADIMRLEADGPYTKFFLVDQKNAVVSRAIGYWEHVLTGEDMPFFRVHESHIVGFSHLLAILNIDGGMVEMREGKKIPIARRRKDEFQKWLENYLA